MSSTYPLEECRRPTLRTWVGAVLIALLLLADVFAATHPFDADAHANGQSCAVCLSAAALGAGAVPAVVHFDAVVATPVVAAVVVAVFVSVVPTRRYARGPPEGSFPL